MSMFKIIIISLGVMAAFFALLIFSGRLPIPGQKAKAPQGNIVVWGTLPQDNMDTFFSNYTIKFKGQQISYKFIKESDFSATLVDALASGIGPDAIIAPYPIILEQSKRIYPYPAQSFPEKTYRDMYVDGASIFWTRSGPLALPVALEPMMLFFNRTLLAKHGVTLPPTYWDELNDMTQKLTVMSSQGTFTESAIALGSYANTLHTKDILSVMVAQLGQFVVFKQTTQEGRDMYSVTANQPVREGGDVFPLTAGLRFFMEFSDPAKAKYTWNQFLPNAQDQFVAEKLAMYIGYAGEAKSIKERNQRIDFDMALLPQSRGYNTLATGMKLYGMATLLQAKNRNLSLAVQATLAGSEWGTPFAQSVGAIPPQRNYLNQQGVSDALRKSALVARGWYDLKPEDSSSLFETMIRDVTSGRVDVSEATSQFVTRLQAKYTNQ